VSRFRRRRTGGRRSSAQRSWSPAWWRGVFGIRARRASDRDAIVAVGNSQRFKIARPFGQRREFRRAAGASERAAGRAKIIRSRRRAGKNADGRARAGFRRQLCLRRTALQRRLSSARQQADTKTANGNPLLGLPEAESVAAPEYYFLRGGNVSGKSPLACQSYPKNAAPIPKFDIEGVRRDFPALHQLVNGKPLIWLDNAATTHKPQAVIDATSQFYSRDNSNIHRAAHALAARSTELFEAGREKVRKFLGAADAKEIVFVRGTTEAINLVAQSYGRKNIGAGDEIIVSELEHHANIVPWQLLAEQNGRGRRVIPINDRGELILEEYVKLLGGKTKFVSVAHVSNSLGTINPVEQIIALAHARGVPVLVDGAQSTPHLPVNVTALDADFYVFSGHKIFARPASARFTAKRRCSKPCRRGRAAAT
jgi:hypothetical protein